MFIYLLNVKTKVGRELRQSRGTDFLKRAADMMKADPNWVPNDGDAFAALQDYDPESVAHVTVKDGEVIVKTVEVVETAVEEGASDENDVESADVIVEINEKGDGGRISVTAVNFDSEEIVLFRDVDGKTGEIKVPAATFDDDEQSVLPGRKTVGYKMLAGTARVFTEEGGDIIAELVIDDEGI